MVKGFHSKNMENLQQLISSVILEMTRMNLQIMEHGFCSERPNLGHCREDSLKCQGFERYGQISNLGLLKFTVPGRFSKSLNL